MILSFVWFDSYRNRHLVVLLTLSLLSSYYSHHNPQKIFFEAHLKLLVVKPVCHIIILSHKANNWLTCCLLLSSFFIILRILFLFLQKSKSKHKEKKVYKNLLALQQHFRVFSWEGMKRCWRDWREKNAPLFRSSSGASKISSYID